MLSATYVICFALGFVFVLMSFILGELTDIFHLTGAHGPGPLSTSVLAMFITGFGIGGYGAINLLKFGQGLSMAVAFAVGLAFAAATYGILRLIYTSGEGSSEFLLEDVVGTQAQVTVPIPEGGRGEVTFVAAKARQIASALSTDGHAIPKSKTVKIVRASGDTLVVEEVKQSS